jgi:soluble lytic murein transglycosylase-like protein
MSICFTRSLFYLLIIATAGNAGAANLVRQTVVAPRVRSVVRADARGRLVRSVILSPRVIQPRVIQSDSGTPRASSVPPNPARVPDLVEAAARKYDMDPLLVHSMIQVESGYNPYAVSPKGAQGLMQLMPGTARRFGVSNTFDPGENIEGGVRYLKYLTTLFPDDPRLALAAYNAGEGAVWKYNYRIPPYRETEDYIYKVARKYGQARRQAKQSRPAETANRVQEATAAPGPVYSPVEYRVDGEGRLYMRTVTAGAAADVGTP